MLQQDSNANSIYFMSDLLADLILEGSFQVAFSKKISSDCSFRGRAPTSPMFSPLDLEQYYKHERTWQRMMTLLVHRWDV